MISDTSDPPATTTTAYVLLLLGVVVPYAPPPPAATTTTTTTASASAVSVLLLLGELWESTSCANLIDVDVTVFQELEYISKIGGGAAAAAWCVCPKPRLLQPGTLLNRWQHCLLSNMQPGYRFP